MPDPDIPNSNDSASLGGLDRDLIETLPLGVVVYHLDDPADPGSLRLVRANEAASRAIGFDAKAEIGRTLHESIPQVIETDIPATYAEVAQTGTPRDLGLVTYGDDRIERATFRVRAHPLPGRHVAVVFQDVSKQTETEGWLRLLTSALANARDAVLITGPELDEPGPAIVYANAAFERLTGYAPDEVKGRSPRFLQGPETDRAVLDRLRARLERGEAFHGEAINYRKDGTPFMMEWEVAPIHGEDGAVTHWIATQRDATERRREALRFRGVFDSAFQHIFLVRPDGTLVEANRTALDFAGVPAADVLGGPIWEGPWWGLSEQTRAELRAAVERAASGELVRYVVDVQGEGEAIAALDLSVKPVHARTGSVEVLIVEGRDITEDVRTQRELRDVRAMQERLAESEARYRFLGETLQQQVWTAGPDGLLDYVNRFTIDYFGRTFEKMIGEGWQAVVHPDDLPEVGKRWARSLETGESYEVEFRLRRAEDGQYRWHISRASALRDEDGRITKWFGTNTDIHEKKRAEEVLAEAYHDLEERVRERTRALAAFSEDLKALHRITTAEHASTEEFMQDYIRTGCAIFDMPVGILSKTPLDEETGEYFYHVLIAESTVPSMEAGWEAPLSDSFCDVVLEREKTVSYIDAREEGEAVRSKPPYAVYGLRSFIGAPIWVDAEVFGTLKFTSPEPRPGGFAAHEHELIEIMAELIGRLLSAQRAEAKRAEADARYRSVVHTIDEGLILVSADGAILMSNPAAQERLGLEDDVAVSRHGPGTPRWRVIDDHGRPVSEHALPEQRVLRSGRPVRGVIQGVVRPDGAVRWYSVNARAASRTLDSEVATVVVSFTDVTEQRQAEAELRASEEQLRKAQEIAHVGSWHWDIDADAITWSDELYRIFGLAPDAFEPTFESYLKRLHPEDRERLQQVVQTAVERQEAYEIDHRLVRPDDEVRYVHSNGEVILNGEGRTIALQGTAQDVTEQRQAEQGLKHYAAALEERNAELEQFAYVASHDLQEPLRMVSSFLQLLQRRYEGQLDETADEYIAYAVDGAKRMQVLIQDLLTYSRVGTRGKPFEPVDLNRAVETVLTDLGPALDEFDAEVTVEHLPTIRADALQMRQLLQNLIGNAVKFRGDAPPEVRVSAERTPDIRPDAAEGGQTVPGWRFSVSDNGIGIASEHAERIFQIFQRLHTRDEYEGTGIGLAMCKKIVERHGGHIWLESALGHGATFYFTLPDHPLSTHDRVDD